MEEKKCVNEEDLNKVSGGLSFGTRTCPDCGKKVAVMFEKQGPFSIITSGQCSCGYDFTK